MLPPHPPFVQKVVRRRIVRRRRQELPAGMREDRPEQDVKVARVPRPLKPTLKVLEQPRAEAQA
jgi:hypothetical protein